MPNAKMLFLMSNLLRDSVIDALFSQIYVNMHNLSVMRTCRFSESVTESGGCWNRRTRRLSVPPRAAEADITNRIAAARLRAVS